MLVLRTPVLLLLLCSVQAGTARLRLVCKT
jgi:hypothetical protein